MKTHLLLVALWLCATGIAAVPEHIQTVRTFLDHSPGAAALVPHLEATRRMLVLYAQTHDLPLPVENTAVPGDPLVALADRAVRLANAYGGDLSLPYGVDPNSPSPQHRQSLLLMTAAALNGMEGRLVDARTAEQTLPLRVELGKELQQPTMTFVSFDGVQREAITARAKALYDQIKLIEASRPLHLAAMNGLYRRARIAMTLDERGGTEAMAARVVDGWLSRQVEAAQKAADAAARRAAQHQRLQQQSHPSRPRR